MFNWLKQTLKKQPEKLQASSEILAIPSAPAAKQLLNLRKQGNRALAAGDNAAAETHFRAALVLNSDDADTLTCMGFALKELGRFEEATTYLLKAIGKTDSAEAKSECYVLLGQIGETRRDTAKAESNYLMALELRPSMTQLGLALFENYRSKGQETKGIELLLGCANRAASAIEYHRKLASIYIERKEFAAALGQLELAKAIDPNDPWIHFAMGSCHHALHHLQDAIACFSQTIHINPNFGPAYTNRGAVYMLQSAFEAADSDLQKAVSLQPDDSIPHCNLGELRRLQQNFSEAFTLFDKSIALNPADPDPYWNKALSCLAAGDFEQGWKLYEYRLLNPNHGGAERPGLARWTGAEPLHGKTILLHAEQGLGDTLQFCRYAMQVSELGARVYLETQSPLLQLLRCLPSSITVVEAGAVLPPIDFHCPLMSLPLVLGETIGSAPPETPYIMAEPRKAAFWKARLAPYADRNLVGLVWNGGFRKDHPELWGTNGRRNIPLEQIAKLDCPHLVFISLQKGDPAESEVREKQGKYWPAQNFVNWAEDLQDFADTAALIENLDLVIAVDTSTAHLAAAMGKPVWLLNRFDACWRWMISGDSSHWYPTLKIYRQTQGSDWTHVIEKVRADLLEKVM